MMITERGNEEYVEDEIKEALSALSWNQESFEDNNDVYIELQIDDDPNDNNSNNNNNNNYYNINNIISKDTIIDSKTQYHDKSPTTSIPFKDCSTFSSAVIMYFDKNTGNILEEVVPRVNVDKVLRNASVYFTREGRNQLTDFHEASSPSARNQNHGNETGWRISSYTSINGNYIFNNNNFYNTNINNNNINSNNSVLSESIACTLETVTDPCKKNEEKGHMSPTIVSQLQHYPYKHTGVDTLKNMAHYTLEKATIGSLSNETHVVENSLMEKESLSKMKCHVCFKGFVGSIKLFKHLKEAHCDEDGLEGIFSPIKRREINIATVDGHEMSISQDENHLGNKYQCTMCVATFSRAFNLKRHMFSHLGVKCHKCPVCEYSFVERSHLTVHMRRHTGEKPYRCHFCDQCFSQQVNLKRHVMTHIGHRPFQCELCPAAFLTAADLRRHIRTHTGEKPYKCRFCPKAFATTGNLHVHVRRHRK